MAQRIKVGIVFSSNEAWIGGTYYILNLIQALQILPEEKQPHLVVFCNKENDIEQIKSLKYAYISFERLIFQYNFFERVINKFSRLLFQKNLIVKKHSQKMADVIFPFDFQESLAEIPHKIAWIPDFQEHFLSHFFSEESLQIRKEHHYKIINANIPIVFSSLVAQQHFYSIFPSARNTTFVLNFAVSHPEYINIEQNELLKKFNISKKYFIAPNQFWIHKNHQIILEAVLQLKKEQKEIPFQIVFTGKEYDFRHPKYTDNLKNFVQANGLSDDILFLGFIDRSEQLKLMENALAVIQPSLFEGWSTVVEDAKAMNQKIILSDIEVHREQATGSNYLFFDPNNISKLSEYILEVSNDSHHHHSVSDYKKNVESFGAEFLRISMLLLKDENALS